ncbi:uncharacterized protein LOC120418987 [Culex pipiens pallens]|uniref:uncharacterized protein LOC120418987 n=1 Tax=Culex pipiens pallens TaxID=42434 RepID=UPI001954571D|nr:uncharacterized protein LOC120418987 [Culex pipiens pallens]
MNQNYVRKCEEYLQNIPSQKLPPSSTGGASRPNLSSRKLTQPGLRQGRQSINNAIPPPVLPPPPAEGSRPKPKPTPVPATGGRRTPCRPPTARPGQLGSKFIRPCCRPKGGDCAGERAGRRGSDNVNQNDVRVMDGAGAGGGGEGVGEGKVTGKTRTWDGILTAESTVETTAAASMTQIKSKATPPSPQAEPSPITSTFPNGAGAAPDSSSNNRDLTLAPNPSLTSLPSSVTSSSVRPASSSIAAVPPRPRPSSTVLDAVTELVPSSTASTARVNQHQKQLQGINLFRFDPLRTLQFLTLELKSKLKPLLLTVPGGSSADDGSAHKQLYKISKELLYAVKILTENAERQRKPSCSCGDKETSDEKVPSKPKGREITEAPEGCQNCLKLQRVEQPGSPCLPRKEINYPKDDLPHHQPEESSKASTTADQQQQLELRRLEGEIKRLQTTISDKQTTTATAEALIDDLNRKLGEATHARDEAQRKLLYATLENERLNFLLRSQCSTMANLRHDFSAIQSLADQQIDLLDRTTDTNGGTNDRSRSKSNTIATTVVVGNHHRNYRYPSGTAQLNPAPPVQERQVAKLRHHHHYSFQNIAEKESDDGNDAAANDYWRNSASQQQLPSPSQKPEVMVRLPSSTHVPEEGAFQQREERPPTGLWHRKNRALVELDESGTSSSGSLTAVVEPARSARFGPTKRALLIDSDRDDDLRDDLEGQHQQHSSSSLSSLTSSQQLRRQDDQRGNNDNGKDIRMETSSRRGLPASGDKPFIMTAKEDDAESCSDYTNNNSHHRHIPNSKTNDCVSLAPKDAEMARNRRQQQLGPNPGGSKKNDDTPLAGVEAKGKYPRDYGDKFERRESLLALAGNGGQEERRQELCQNRPIMGQIRRRSSSLETGKEGEEVLVGKIISAAAANEPASGQTSRTMTKTTTTEEFSIDFDDITLPPSPIPFRRRKDEAGGGPVDEFPSSFGDWM